MAKMGSEKTIVALGQVEYIETSAAGDDAAAGRIKVRLDSDESKSTADLDWAWPLNSSLFHCIPKVGEGVLVITAQAGQYDSQRYYIGPIISQPQFLEFCQYNNGHGDAVSLLQGAKTVHNDPLTSINRSQATTKGAFPNNEDVALIGRGQEDIVLKYKAGDKGGDTSEIDLRAGIRLKATDASVKYLQGNVVFNTENPSYIQLKRGASGLAGLKAGTGDAVENKYEGPEKREATALVNIVADKINLISHKDSNTFGENITDRDELVKYDQMDEIMSNLHRAVYGDELVTLLKLIVNALRTHTHPFSMLPPTEGGTTLEDLADYSYEKILSPNVRLS